MGDIAADEVDNTKGPSGKAGALLHQQINLARIAMPCETIRNASRSIGAAGMIDDKYGPVGCNRRVLVEPFSQNPPAPLPMQDRSAIPRSLPQRITGGGLRSAVHRHARVADGRRRFRLPKVRM